MVFLEGLAVSRQADPEQGWLHKLSVPFQDLCLFPLVLFFGENAFLP